MVKKVILLGRKPGAAKALKWLITNGIQVPFVVANHNENYTLNLKNTAEMLGIPVYLNDESVYDLIRKDFSILDGVDLVISYLHNKKIRYPLIRLGRRGCVNFHPAILPDYKSSAGYNTAILDQKDVFGVSAHFIDSEDFDAGPIIQVSRFPINHLDETAHSLERKAQEKLFELFVQVMNLFITRDKIQTRPNSGGLYLTKSQIEKMRIVDPENDTQEDIDRKIRAFFFPPYHGAKIILAGKEYTLINEEVLKYIAELIVK